MITDLLTAVTLGAGWGGSQLKQMEAGRSIRVKFCEHILDKSYGKNPAIQPFSGIKQLP